MTRFDGLMGKLSKTKQTTDHNTEERKPEPSTTPSPQRKRKGKRNDPTYTQVTAYIRKETHHQVKIALLQDGSDREFSELVEDLLSEYLRTQKLG